MAINMDGDSTAATATNGHTQTNGSASTGLEHKNSSQSETLGQQAKREGRDHTFELVKTPPKELGVPDADAVTETHLTRSVANAGQIEGQSAAAAESGCYATLLTRQTYLPGLIVLARSLRMVKSAYPLLVLRTATLEPEAVATLDRLGIAHVLIEAIAPPANASLIAERFADTWTKLRVLELVGTTDSLGAAYGFDRVVMIDNDMMVLQNMDELFTTPLAEGHILASHGCICNLDDSSWAPASFRRENCPFTPQRPSDALLQPAGTHMGLPEGHHQLNSGLVVLRPSLAHAARVRDYMHSPRDGELFQFPDQDVLLAVYGKENASWGSLSWTYNAVKISRDWHRDSWIDAACKNLHYICDKPWRDAAGRDIARKLVNGEMDEVQADKKDPYLHRWWWRQWEQEMSNLSQRPDGGEKLCKYLESLVEQ